MPFYPVPPQPLPESPWRHAPLLKYAACVMVGIAVAWVWRAQVGAGTWLAAAAVSGALTCLLYRWGQSRPAYRFAVWTGAALTLALAAASLLANAYGRVTVSWPETERTWTGHVISLHKHGDTGSHADLRLADDQAAYAGREVRVFLAGAAARRVEPGALIVFRATLRADNTPGNPGDFDYSAYLLSHGISGQAYVPETAWQASETAASDGWRVRLLQLRGRLVAAYARHFAETDFAILAALTLGEKAYLRADTRALFAETGTSHILALSGLHLGILFCLIQFLLLRRLRRPMLFHTANALTLCGLWVFVGLAGAPLSLVRAATMFSLLHVGYALRRTHAATLNNLAFAALVILLFEPLALLDVGFQLSFLSVFAIVVVGQYVWLRFPLPEWSETPQRTPVLVTLPGKRVVRRPDHRPFTVRLRAACIRHGYGFFRSTLYPLLCVSLSAQVGTLPLVILYFHILPLYSLAANLVVIPAAYGLLGGALLFFLVPLAPWQRFVAEALQEMLSGLTEALSFLGSLPGAYLKLYPTGATLLAASLLPVLVYACLQTRRRRLRLRLIGLSAALVLVGIGCETHRLTAQSVRPQIVIYRMPRTTNVHFIHRADRSWLYADPAPDSLRQRWDYVRQNFFEPRGIRPPALLGNGEVRSAHLLRTGDYFIFSHTRLYLLRRRLPRLADRPPQPLDVLLVAYPCRHTLAEVRHHFAPRRVVLDNTLPHYLKRRWQAECAAAHVPCHDLYAQGAFVLPLEE